MAFLIPVDTRPRNYTTTLKVSDPYVETSFVFFCMKVSFKSWNVGVKNDYN